MNLRQQLERLLRVMMLVFVLAAAAFLSALTTIRIAIRGRVVTMPSLVGKASAQAQQALASSGLQLRVADRVYSSSVPVNAVVRQSPPPGEEVKLSQNVQVVLSLGPQTVTIPGIEGRTMRAARITLLESGLELGEVSTAYLPSSQPDTVLLQDPPRDSAATSPRVDVLVGTGDRPAYYVMPALMGMEQPEAERLLASAGLRVGRISYSPQAGAPKGTVIGQNPAAGARTAGDTMVELSFAQ